MKKISIIILLIASVLICGCQKNESDIRGGYESEAASEDVSDATSEDASDATSKDASDATDVSSEEELSLGSRDGNVYKSEFIGLSYKLNDGLSFYTDEQIKQLNNIASDLAGDEFKEAIKNATVIYDMYASDSAGTNNIAINLEKVNPVQLVVLDIAKNYEAVADVSVKSFENMGFTNVKYEITAIEIDGKTLDALCITSEFNGVKVYQTLFSKKCSGYLASVAVSSFGEDNSEEIFKNIEWLD